MNEEQIQNLSRQVQGLANRLARIESRLGIQPLGTQETPSNDAPTKSTPEKHMSPTSTAHDSYQHAKTATALPLTGQPLAAKQPPATTSTLLAAVASLCFLLAAGSFVKLSIESNWLTPQLQVVGAALLGWAFIHMGYLLKKHDHHYAAVLPAIGISILYLTLYAAHFLYGFISQEGTAAISIALAIGCLFIHLEFKSDYYPVIASLSTYLVPVLFTDVRQNSTSIAIFYLVWALLFSWLASAFKTRALLLTSSYFGIGSFLISLLALKASGSTFESSEVMFLLCVHALQFFIFGTGLGIFSAVHGESMSRMQAFCLAPLVFCFYGSEFELAYLQFSTQAPYIMIAIAAVACGLFAVLQRTSMRSLEGWLLVEMLLGLTALHSVYVMLWSPELKPLFALLLIGVSVSPLRRFMTLRAWNIAIGLVVIAEAGRILSHLIDVIPVPEGDPYRLSIWHLYGASIAPALIFAGAQRVNKLARLAPPWCLLFAGHVFGVATIFSLTQGHGSLAVSLGWGAYALAILCLGFSRRHKTLAKSSLYILLFSVGKVLLYDIGEADKVVRILCLLLTGTLLYVHGLILRRIERFED